MTRLVWQLQNLSSTIINSSTKYLPSWHGQLVEMGQPVHIIPRNVRTCWNSTYNLCEFALGHKTTIDSFVTVKEPKLRKYLLDLHEWELISQLSEVLRVHHTLSLVNQISDTCSHCQMLKNMTQEFSVTLEALLHQVIPAMHRVNDLFDGYLKQNKSVQHLDPAL